MKAWINVRGSQGGGILVKTKSMEGLILKLRTQIGHTGVQRIGVKINRQEDLVENMKLMMESVKIRFRVGMSCNVKADGRIEIMKCVDRREEKVGMMTAGKGNTKEMKRKISTGSMRKKETLSMEGMNRRRSIEAECVIVTKVMIHTRGLDMMIHILVEGEDMTMKSMLIGRLGGESCSIDIVSCRKINSFSSSVEGKKWLMSGKQA
uniref:Putative ovule protein n=1 Tax=Solanum chacoense TaxID=4108 RepID=A0A0V0HSK6_SOLCH